MQTIIPILMYCKKSSALMVVLMTLSMPSFARGQVPQNEMDLIKQQVAAHKTLFSSVRATVHEKIEVPPSEMPKDANPNVQYWGNVPSERDYEWEMKGDDVKIFCPEPALAAKDARQAKSYQTIINHDNKQYELSSDPHSESGGTANFGKIRGTYVMPDRFVYKCQGKWLADVLTQAEWSALRKGTDSQFGNIVTLEGTFNNAKTTLALSVDNNYICVRQELRDNGRLWTSEVQKLATVNGIPFPIAMVSKLYQTEDAGSLIVQTRFLTVRDLKFDAVDDKVFIPQWKKGMMVKDSETNIVYRFRNGQLEIDPLFNQTKIGGAGSALAFLFGFCGVGLGVIYVFVKRKHARV